MHVKKMKRIVGQAIIELALILPLCALLLLGTIDLLRACYQQQVLNQAARAAVRCAIVEPHLSEAHVPEAVILAEAIRVLQSGNIDPTETIIDIKVPGFNYLVGQADLTTDPIIVSIQYDFKSFLARLLDVNHAASPRTLATLEGLAAGYYENIGTLIDRSVLEKLYPPVVPPPPPDRDKDGVPDAKDRWPDDPREAYDTDRDGVGNNADTDDDDDGLDDPDDPNDWNRDIDGDGIPDGKDDDMDGDGISNTDEKDIWERGQYNAPSAEG